MWDSWLQGRAKLMAVLPARPPRSQNEAIQQIRARAAITRVLTGLVWIVIVGMVLVIVVAYLA
jgi:type VI protein secretion system component VasF